MTLKKLIDKWKFDYINSNITETTFPLVKRKHGEYKLFHFDKRISSEDAVKEILQSGYLPANIQELLEWKDWNEEYWVVALGSVGDVYGDVYGDRCVPFLYGEDYPRDLNLRWWSSGWYGACRFLAVKSLDRSDEAVQKLLSDSLKLSLLEKIKELEDLVKTI